MTGYGKAEAELEAGKLCIEIRSLNGKNADANIKTSLLPKDKELLVRQKLTQRLGRGTIDFYANWESGSAAASGRINEEALKGYLAQLESIREDLGMTGGNSDELLSAIIRLPDVVDSKRNDYINEENWPLVEEAIDKAIAAVTDYRRREGEALYKDVTSRVANILALEEEVEKLEGERLTVVRERLEKNLAELKVKVDPARIEQEMIFYLEKLDINEEKVRLRQHCRYFMDTIDGEPCPGKKLGFIIQEMGREINTTGSKANHAGIQKLVVRMKDELEKIREQSLNIL